MENNQIETNLITTTAIDLAYDWANEPPNSSYDNDVYDEIELSDAEMSQMQEDFYDSRCNDTQKDNIYIESSNYGKVEEIVETQSKPDKNMLESLQNQNLKDAKKSGDEVDDEVKKKRLEEAEKYELNYIKEMAKHFSSDERKISDKSNIYGEIKDGTQDKIAEDSLNDFFLDKTISDLKRTQLEDFIKKVSSTISNNIIFNIQEDKTLVPTTSNSRSIIKKEREFFLHCLKVVNKWTHNVSTDAQSIQNDIYIHQLFTEFNYKIVNPNLFDFEKNFSGEEGLLYFIHRVAHFTNKEQREILINLNIFLKKNLREPISLEKIFML